MALCWPQRARGLRCQRPWAFGPAATSPTVPLKSVEPPESTILENSVRRRSMSDLWMAKARTSWSPSLSSPTRSGWKSSSGARKRAGPTCMERKTEAQVLQRSQPSPLPCPVSYHTGTRPGHLRQVCCRLEGCTAPSQSQEPHPSVG